MSIFGTAAKASGGQVGAGASASAGALNTSSTNLIVAIASGSQGSGATCSFSDTIGNSFTALGSPSSAGQNNTNVVGSIFGGYCLSSSGSNASNVVKATFGTSQSYAWIYVWNVPLTGAASFDTNAFGNSTSSGNSPITNSFTTTGTDELVLVAAGNDFTGVTYSAGNVGGIAATLDSSGFVSGIAGSEHQTFSSTQSGITAAMSQGSSTDWLIAALAFKGGGGPPPSSGKQTQIIFLGW